MCTKYPAVLTDSLQEQDMMVPLFSGYGTMIDRNQINRCIINCKGDPAKLQRLLLIAVKGKAYIAQHSAGGQRARGNDDQPPKGHPAADEDLLSAVELFVKFKFSETGSVAVPSIVETYNRLAGNLRSAEARKMGKYQYPKKPRAKKRKEN
ncbi:hypothetical protein B566_EDAN008709 [Ephemera danica]|nr:hypothetical protein B566_EDAN008709 [Ephemera danica]